MASSKNQNTQAVLFLDPAELAALLTLALCLRAGCESLSKLVVKLKCLTETSSETMLLDANLYKRFVKLTLP